MPAITGIKKFAIDEVRLVPTKEWFADRIHGLPSKQTIWEALCSQKPIELSLIDRAGRVKLLIKSIEFVPAGDGWTDSLRVEGLLVDEPLPTSSGYTATGPRQFDGSFFYDDPNSDISYAQVGINTNF